MIEGWDEPLSDFSGEEQGYTRGFTCKWCGSPRFDWSEFNRFPHLCIPCWNIAAHNANLAWDAKLARPLDSNEQEVLKEMIQEWLNSDVRKQVYYDSVPNLSPGEDHCPSGARIKEQESR